MTARIQEEASSTKLDIDHSGWEELNTWLSQAVETRQWSVVEDLLKLFLELPVNVELLRTNSCAKLIRFLSQRDDTPKAIRALSTDIVTIWKDLIIGEASQTDSSVKKVRSPTISKEGFKQPAATSVGVVSSVNVDMRPHADPNIDPESSGSSPSSPTDDSPNLFDNLKILASESHLHGPTSKTPSTKVSPLTPPLFGDAASHRLKQAYSATSQKLPPPSNKPMSSNTVSAQNGVGPSSSYSTSSKPKDCNQEPRKATVKAYTSKFRSTGLEQDVGLPGKQPKQKPPQPMPTSKPTSAQTQTQVAAKPVSAQTDTVKTAIKRSSTDDTKPPHLPKIPKKESSSGSTNGTTSSAASGDSPKSNNNGTTVVSQPPVAPPPAKPKPRALDTTPRQNITRKKKVSSATTVATKAAPSTTATVQKLDSEPPSTSVPMEISTVEIEVAPGGSSIPTSSSEGSGNVSKSKTETSTSKPPSVVKKRVTWKKEEDMLEVRYFDVEEGERINVNRPKGAEDMKHREMQMDRQRMDEAKRMMHGVSVSSGAGSSHGRRWKLIPIDNINNSTTGTINSEEAKIQEDRCASVLAELFTTGDSPKEPDFEPIVAREPKIIPLDEQATPASSLPSALSSLLGTINTTTASSQIANTDVAFLRDVMNTISNSQRTGNVPSGANSQPTGPPPAQNLPPPTAPNMQMNVPFNAPMMGPPPLGMPPHMMHVGPPPPQMFNGPPGFNMPGFPSQAPPNFGGGMGPPGPRGTSPPYNNGICRFFMQGHCSHGARCRHLHPGVNSPPI